MWGGNELLFDFISALGISADEALLLAIQDGEVLPIGRELGVHFAEHYLVEGSRNQRRPAVHDGHILKFPSKMSMGALFSGQHTLAPKYEVLQEQLSHVVHVIENVYHTVLLSENDSGFHR